MTTYQHVLHGEIIYSVPLNHSAKKTELISRTRAHALYLEASGGVGDDAEREAPEQPNDD